MANFNEAVYFTNTADFSNATNFLPKAGSITNSSMAVSGIMEYTEAFGFAIGATHSAKEIVRLVARATGTLMYAYAGLVESGAGSDTTSFDLNIDGTSALTAAIAVGYALGDRTNVAGAVAGAGTIAVGDVISCSCEAPLTAASATGPFLTFGILWTSTAS